MPDLNGLYGLPPGADFPAELVAGLLDRYRGAPPEALARVEIVVNTQRMRRRILDAFADGPARLLPRLRLVTDLANAPLASALPTVRPLRRQLELTQLIGALLDREPDMAARTDAFALAESLAALLAEMEDEAVAPGAVAALDVGDMSAHWERARAFLGIVEAYQNSAADTGPNAALRAAVSARIAAWQAAPPADPVILAGSTGSRGTTQALMQAVARLPVGAVVLPGFDFEQPGIVWQRLTRDDGLEDHPQFRFASLLYQLGRDHGAVRRWRPTDPVAARNRAISLALRPAPVTDQWIAEGAGLGDLRDALSGIDLIEASDPRHEALAIALCLRDAAGAGRTAALVTPDRTLARRVTAELDRWRIVPDDSAGRPLALTAPGRLLRQVAALAGAPAPPAALLALLKHPLTATGNDRGPHLLWTRRFELWLRRQKRPEVGTALLADWAETQPDPAATAWAAWLIEALQMLGGAGRRTLAAHVARHRALAERLAGGPDVQTSGALWQEEPGIAAQTAMAELESEAEAGGEMTPGQYARLIDGLLATSEVRATAETDPRVAILGTLEARVQGAELVILAGLTEGTWPALPAPDPWLNRQMRRAAGLLSPERRIGLSAHDFQQAVAAQHVVLSRAKRDAEAETVMSRWLNRLYNLVQGLPDQHGPEAWAAMQARGSRWTDLARCVDLAARVEPAPRPAPRPPVDDRPKGLSVTQIQTLIRDPYAIYARHILRLKPLDPLSPRPDPALRGDVMHRIVELFVQSGPAPEAPGALDHLTQIAEDVLNADVSWPETRLFWAGQIARVADWFLESERVRRASAAPECFEVRGDLPLTPSFVLTGKIDRIDRRPDGRLVIYDYKTGSLPSKKQLRLFDRQLMLEAIMAEAGAVHGLGPAAVAEVAHIGLGASPKEQRHALRAPGDDMLDPAVERQLLLGLIGAFETRSRGYAARRAMESVRYDGDYDHLARYGEWDVTDAPQGIDVG